MPTADISGLQRKVIEYSARPSRLSLGDTGIPIRNGKTLPFVVERGWSAPEGQYNESFYLIDTTSREVLYEGPTRERLVWGLQSVSEFADTVRTPIELQPGRYALVFALDGVSGGEFPVEAFEVAEEAA